MNTQLLVKKAFSRNLGLISALEQSVLAQSLVAIPGCGGIGSTVAETLARLGVGGFRLCDPDHFDVANFNRQTAATLHTLKQNKAEATRDRILAINPSAHVEVITKPLTPNMAEAFVAGADIVLDGMDFFVLGVRRAIFKAAAKANIPAMTAAPLGFSATLHLFMPNEGMSFESFFDFNENDSAGEQVMKFLVGLAPKALQRPYMDMSYVNAQERTGPSSIIGTQLASTLIGGQVLRVLLKRGHLMPAPAFVQVDVYRHKLVKGWLPWGNRHPLQRLKLRLARQSFEKKGLWQDLCELDLA